MQSDSDSAIKTALDTDEWNSFKEELDTRELIRPLRDDTLT